MVKKPKQERSTPSEGDGFTTFSIRLSETQREYLLEAARLKGWTPTQLVRIATIEKAVAIRNTATPHAFDYKGLAAELASRWFASRVVEYVLTVPDLEYIHEASRDGDTPALAVPVPSLPVETFRKVKQAAEQGGGEFLTLLVEFAEGLTAPHRTDLPMPIDPKKVLGREE